MQSYSSICIVIVTTAKIALQSSKCSYYSTLDLPGNKLTLDDFGLLLDELLDVHTQWYPLGLQLKVKVEILDRIREQFPDPRDQLQEMLKTWLITSDNTSWKSLTDALSSRSVGASQLANDLEAKGRPKHMRKSKL